MPHHQFWTRGTFVTCSLQGDCIGGCNGCIDLTNPAILGMTSAFQAARNLALESTAGPSLADMIAFIGKSALENACSKAGHTVSVEFLTWRIDCDDVDLPPPDDDLPPSDMTDAVSYLRRQFPDVNTTEAVALMGCHSLGQLHPEISGFSGQWDRVPVDIDNGYFRNML